MVQNNRVIINLHASDEVAFVGLFQTEYPGCGIAISSNAYYGQDAGENAANQ